ASQDDSCHPRSDDSGGATRARKASSTAGMRRVALLTMCLFAASIDAARADDWEVKRNPFDPVVIAKYKSILARDPHDRDALQRLINLYKAYSKVDKLEAEYKAEAESWSSLVVLARLPRTDKAAT